MDRKTNVSPAPFRIATVLLLGGQALYIAITLLHAGGPANDHQEIFQTYAHNQIWMGVHLGQFAAFAIMSAGLLAFFQAADLRHPSPNWLNRAGAGAAVAALALYGALQAVDGVALKQAVAAWAMAPEAERAARFASAETVRWLEWGMRSYHDFAFALALLACAGVALRNFGALMGLCVAASSAAYVAQGWLVGVEGFSPAQSNAIVLGWALSLVWIVALAVISWRAQDARPSQGE